MEKTMLDYIKESVDAELNIINNSDVYTKQLVDAYLEKEYEGLCFIASGSSYNACLCARDFMQHFLDVEVKIITPFTFIHHEIEHIHNLMFIAVSQSGCSTNTLEAIKEIKNRGYKAIALVGRDDCDAKQISDLLVNWQVGEEKIGFVTKGVNTLVTFLMCYAVELAKAKDIININKYSHIKQKLIETVNLQEELMNNTIKIFNDNKQDFINPSRVVLLSSGPNFGTISEGALKIAETSCITAIAYEAEEFLHGPLYPSKPEDLIILVDNNEDPSSDRIIDIGLALKDITDKVYVVSNNEAFDENHRFSTVNQTCLHRSPLYKLTCLQTLAYLMSEATNKYEPHEVVKQFKKANKVASKSRDNLYLNLQKIS